VSQVPTDLAAWVELRDLSRAEIEQRFEIGPGGTAEGVKYQGLAPVTRLSNMGRFPGHFFFREEDRPAMIYIGDRDALATLDAGDLQTALGGPGVKLPSRVGKRAVHHLYPEAGIAFSAEGDDVKLLEIFAPTTREAYEAEVHLDPGPFIR
jgi:hypothetical protein